MLRENRYPTGEAASISLSGLEDFHADETKDHSPKLSGREKGGTPLWPKTSLAGLSQNRARSRMANSWGCCGQYPSGADDHDWHARYTLSEAGVIELPTPAPNFLTEAK